MLLAPPPPIGDAATGFPLQSLLPIVGSLSSITMIVLLRNNPVMVVVGAVILVVALVVACVWLFARTRQARPSRAARVTLIAVGLQGLIGYAQYFLGLPVGIVILHMVGLTVLTAAAAWLLVSTTRRAHAHQPGADHRPSLHAS